MIALLTTLFTSIISGGATGILGVAVQRYFDLKNKSADVAAKKLQFAHELDMRKADADIMAQEWAGRTKVAELEGEAQADVADAQAFAASFKEPTRYTDAKAITPAQTWAFVVLDFMRGAVRPFLTIYLCGITTLIYFQAHALLKEGPAPGEALELVRLVVGTVLYLTTTCVLWWFGTRNKQTPPKALK